MMSKGGGRTQTTTQTNDPWGPAQPYILDVLRRGQGLSNSSLLAPQSPETLQAQTMQAQRAQSGSPLLRTAQSQNMATMRGDYTDLSKNPAAQNAMDLTRAKINSQFQGNNYGSSAHQEWLGRGLLQAASPFYESERGRQEAATMAAPGLAMQDYGDIGQLGAVGAAKDTRAQEVADFPWQGLSRYAGLLSGSPLGQGTTTSQQPYFQNSTAQTLGNLGLLGTMLYFSDARLKTDIEKVGKRKDGLNVYSFRYKGDPEQRVGLMAQEVLMKKPEAVHDFGGILAVDYAKV